MCGRSTWIRRSGFESRRDLGAPFGFDIEEMGPRARIVTALAVLVPVALSGIFLVAVAPVLWWIFTTYGWVAFPAFGLLLRGLAGMPAGVSADDRERELLEALRGEGEISATRAAVATSLSVAEAEEMLRELAEAGHLEVRVHGGAIFYALWSPSAALEAGARDEGEGS